MNKNMKRLSGLFAFLCLLMPNVVHATGGTSISNQTVANQKKVVKGIVKDEAGEPLIGVSVIIKGTTVGTITNFDGEYSIEAYSPDAIVEFSYIGYQTQSLPINSRDQLNVTLREDTQLLDEIVVTAMGFERESKSLTYATQTIKSEELTRIKDPNFINSLQGKSAGLIITPNNSGAGGGSSKIVLRGQTSILGTNQPLIVLDGVPMSDGMSSQSTELLSGAGRDGGDLLSTINPDDIASMTVLKGPNAAALYGSSANNGVIIITTKNGEQGNVKVNISSTTSVETLFNYPKTQTIYGLTPNATLEAWGGKIADMTQDEIASRPYYTASPRNPVKDFFNTGLTFNNSITLNGGNEMARTYFSYANTTQSGMIENNKFSKHNVTLKETFNLFDKRLSINLGLNYIHQETKNSPVIGRVLSPLHALYRMPANVDMRYFRNNYAHIGTMADNMVSDLAIGNRKLLGQPIQTWYWYDQHLNNPYWLTNMHNDERIKDRILGNISAKVVLWRNLEYQTRFNMDTNLDTGLNTEYATSQRESQGKGGQYWSNAARSIDLFNDHILSISEKIKDDFQVTGAIGASISRNFSRSRSITTVIDTAGIPNAFVPQNSAHKRPNNPNGSATAAYDSYDNTNWATAGFATASVGWREMVYLDGSYRLEWAKSFQQFAQRKDDYISFHYYSAGANVLIDRMIPWKVEQINQIKLRGSYSVVGNPIPNVMYSRQELDFSTGSISSRPPLFDDPKPETTTSYETGLEMWLFNNTLDFDITYYNSTLRNQFLRVSTSSGEEKPVNTGKIRNQGVEFSINYRMAFNHNWRWTSGFNIAYNQNKILETYQTGSGAPYIVTMGPSNFKLKYLQGGAYGDIYVNSFARDKNNNIIVNNAGDYENAVPQMASGEYKTFVGNTTAPVNLGWNNTISWKNFTFYALIDGKIGGKVMSLTEPDRDYYGLSVRSANDRLNGERVIQNGKEYVLKTLPDGQKVAVEKYYRTVGSNPMEDYVYDATNLRLRDIAVGYTFRNVLGKSSDLNLSFTVKNACFIYKNSPVDPDISVSAANGFSGIDSYSLPTVRSYGLNLKLNF